VRTYGEHLTASDRERAARIAAQVPAGDIPTYTFEGLAVGEHALAGALRFYARATVEGEPEGEAVLRRYFHAALLTACQIPDRSGLPSEARGRD